jgi:hypothetical protein
MSRETSFVAIERRETPVLGDVKLRRIPIALTSGWGGLDRLPPAIVAAMSAPSVHDTAVHYLGSPRLASEGELDMSVSMRRAMPRPSASRAPGAFRKALDRLTRRSSGADSGTVGWGGEPDRAHMHALIALQRADGSWELTKELAAVLGQDLDTLEAAVPLLDNGSRSDARTAWATALAVRWLQEHASVLEGEWSSLVQKSQSWLKALPTLADGATWTAAAARFYARHPGRPSLASP